MYIFIKFPQRGIILHFTAKYIEDFFLPKILMVVCKNLAYPLSLLLYLTTS